MDDELDKRAWLRSAFPSYGPDWDAAIEFGVDVSLLVRNLELTPLERLRDLEAMLEQHDALKLASDGAAER